MSSAEIIRYQIGFATWATERVLNAAATLPLEEQERDFGTADKSIRATLLHIYRSERAWLARLEGRVPQWSADGEEHFAFLIANWPILRRAWQDWAASLDDDDASKAITYQDLKRNSWTNSIVEIVLHVVNHSTHHRGQVAGFLRALGKTPPNLDSINYARQNKSPLSQL